VFRSLKAYHDHLFLLRKFYSVSAKTYLNLSPNGTLGVKSDVRAILGGSMDNRRTNAESKLINDSVEYMVGFLVDLAWFNERFITHIGNGNFPSQRDVSLSNGIELEVKRIAKGTFVDGSNSGSLSISDMVSWCIDLLDSKGYKTKLDNRKKNYVAFYAPVLIDEYYSSFSRLRDLLTGSESFLCDPEIEVLLAKVYEVGFCGGFIVFTTLSQRFQKNGIVTTHHADSFSVLNLQTRSLRHIFIWVFDFVLSNYRGSINLEDAKGDESEKFFLGYSTSSSCYFIEDRLRGSTICIVDNVKDNASAVATLIGTTLYFLFSLGSLKSETELIKDLLVVMTMKYGKSLPFKDINSYRVDY